mmetsp:Transcript_10484/g.23065  ORF Transcript_10484/g.23065 Transcript_10484/m.23065 type:complete len:274 (+) Transcript_10484:91-912(+)
MVKTFIALACLAAQAAVLRDSKDDSALACMGPNATAAQPGASYLLNPADLQCTGTSCQLKCNLAGRGRCRRSLLQSENSTSIPNFAAPLDPMSTFAPDSVQLASAFTAADSTAFKGLPPPANLDSNACAVRAEWRTRPSSRFHFLGVVAIHSLLVMWMDDGSVLTCEKFFDEPHYVRCLAGVGVGATWKTVERSSGGLDRCVTAASVYDAGRRCGHLLSYNTFTSNCHDYAVDVWNGIVSRHHFSHEAPDYVSCNLVSLPLFNCFPAAKPDRH